MKVFQLFPEVPGTGKAVGVGSETMVMSKTVSVIHNELYVII